MLKNIVQKISLSFSALLLVATITGATASAASQTATQLKPCVVSVKKGSKPPKTITRYETIHFGTTKQNDGTLAQGTTKQLQTGHDGKRAIIYTASYKKSKLLGCKHTGTKVATKPVQQMVSVGTYVAPAPTPAPAATTTNSTSSGSGYVNSSGNYVPSPSSDPTGATARCGDGTYSYSQHRSGTCSHHSGVAEWL
jgi:hypothetical protein